MRIKLFASLGVFDTRVQQHFKESEKNPLHLMKNYKIINKKVKTFGKIAQLSLYC